MSGLTVEQARSPSVIDLHEATDDIGIGPTVTLSGGQAAEPPSPPPLQVIDGVTGIMRSTAEGSIISVTRPGRGGLGGGGFDDEADGLCGHLPSELP